jgi:predicted metal-binding protein
MIKIGIIRCQQTEDMCPGTADFKVAYEGKITFAETGPAKIVGFVSCGGCPCKRAVSRAMMMIERGAEAIVLASCISKGNPINFPCPHYEEMKKSIAEKILPGKKIIEWTH